MRRNMESMLGLALYSVVLIFSALLVKADFGMDVAGIAVAAFGCGVLLCWE